jgi:hypothetical protein
MRLRLLATLFICCAVAIGIRAHTCRVVGRHARAAAPAKARAEEKKPATWTDTALGVGENAEEAEDVALEIAAKKVHDYLVGRDPAAQWTPPPAYVKAHLLKGAPRTEPVKPEQAGPGVKFRVEVNLEVPPREYERLVARDQEYRKEQQEERQKQQRLAMAQVKQQRLLILARVVAGLVAVCVALAVYLRLDEATKGSYTRWLRLAAVGFVGAIGAGLWLLLPCCKDRLAH